MKKVFKFLVLATALYFLPRFCEEKTDGFSISRISSSLPHDPHWEINIDPMQMKAVENMINNKKFTYLKSGGQCFVFLSEDGRYVIKFFKYHLRRPFPIFSLPFLSSLKEKQQAKRGKKLLRDFQSYKLAFERLQNETGLLYVQLNKTPLLSSHITIVDKIGIHHKLDLSKMEFILQKKADLLCDHLYRLNQEEKLDEAKKIIEKTCLLLIKRSKMEIFDEDPSVHRNVGVVDQNPIIIDVGRLKIDPRALQYREMLPKILKRFGLWLEELNPELYDHLQTTSLIN
ncbi:MAG: hypothetical protein L0207_03550 [Chlamydiae bacterium]|nr:hypothetical protein [Chlamydiota bacterium]